MQQHSTNYFNTFIEMSEDSNSAKSMVPQEKNGMPIIASLHCEIISRHPYEFTSDGVLFEVFTQRNNIEKKKEKLPEKFFSPKGSHAREHLHEPRTTAGEYIKTQKEKLLCTAVKLRNTNRFVKMKI